MAGHCLKGDVKPSDTYALIDIWCASYTTSPGTVTLDIDDTVDIVHGHYDERCFLPIHIYDTTTDRPVIMILRPGRTPSGAEVRRWQLGGSMCRHGVRLGKTATAHANQHIRLPMGEISFGLLC